MTAMVVMSVASRHPWEARAFLARAILSITPCADAAPSIVPKPIRLL